MCGGGGQHPPPPPRRGWGYLSKSDPMGKSSTKNDSSVSKRLSPSHKAATTPPPRSWAEFELWRETCIAAQKKSERKVVLARLAAAAGGVAEGIPKDFVKHCLLAALSQNYLDWASMPGCRFDESGPGGQLFPDRARVMECVKANRRKALHSYCDEVMPVFVEFVQPWYERQSSETLATPALHKNPAFVQDTGASFANFRVDRRLSLLATVPATVPADQAALAAFRRDCEEVLKPTASALFDYLNSRMAHADIRAALVCQLKKLGREAKTNGWASLAPWFDATGTFIPGDGFVEWLFARYPSQTANIIQALDPAAFAHERAAKQQASKGSAAKPQ